MHLAGRAIYACWKKMTFLAPKRNSSDSESHLDQEDSYFTGLGKTFLHEIVVNLGIKVKFENVGLNMKLKKKQ